MARQTLFPIEPLDLLVIHPPAFTAQPHTDVRAPIPPLDPGNRSHSRSKFAIVPSAATISQCVPIQVHQLAHPSLAQPKACDDLLSRRLLRLGPYQFLAVIAFSAWIANACSVTICVNCRFPSSRWRSFFTSLTARPAYFVRHVWNVTSEMPCFRHRSWTLTPAWASFNTAMIGSSVCRFRVKGLRLSTHHHTVGLPSQWCSFRGGGRSRFHAAAVAKGAVSEGHRITFFGDWSRTTGCRAQKSCRLMFHPASRRDVGYACGPSDRWHLIQSYLPRPSRLAPT